MRRTPKLARTAAALLVTAGLMVGAGVHHAAAAPNAPWINYVQAAGDLPAGKYQAVVLYQDTSTSESGFEIGEFDYTTHQLHRLLRLSPQAGSGEHAYLVSDLKPGTSYCFRIRGLLPASDAQRLISTTVWSDERCMHTWGEAPSVDRSAQVLATTPRQCHVCQLLGRP